ncbi:hypothetical protein LT493_32485 [Streptomyces tricolor]|nr:hypothetical protein [Streptomyces tricolor]
MALTGFAICIVTLLVAGVERPGPVGRAAARRHRLRHDRTGRTRGRRPRS